MWRFKHERLQTKLELVVCCENVQGRDTRFEWNDGNAVCRFDSGAVYGASLCMQKVWTGD